jgi:hypothetical protein
MLEYTKRNCRGVRSVPKFVCPTAQLAESANDAGGRAVVSGQPHGEPGFAGDGVGLKSSENLQGLGLLLHQRDLLPPAIKWKV